MAKESRHTGRHHLQIPGPTPVPERILNAMSRQMLDHRGPEFQELGLKVLASAKSLFKTGTRSSSSPPRAPAPGRPASSIRCRRATAC